MADEQTTVASEVVDDTSLVPAQGNDLPVPVASSLVPVDAMLPALWGAIPTQAELGDMLRFGKVLMASGMFSDLQGAAQAVVKIIAGRTFGLDAIQSQMAFQMVQGRLTQQAKFQNALIRRSRFWKIRTDEQTEEACILAFYHRELDHSGSLTEWELVGTSSFSIRDAAKANLGKSSSGKPGAWQMYPRAMLYARALTQGATWYCPHLLLGPGFAGADDNAELAGWDEQSEEE